MRTDATQAFFGLRRPPFGKEVEVDDLWLDPSREQAVSRLVEAAHRRQHALVRGEPGVGKNCVTRAMRQRLPETAFRVVYVANVTVGRRDFYRQLSLALGLQPHGTVAAVFEAVQREVRGSWSEHRVHPVLVVDEAHLMPDATLSHLHVLANFDMDSRPLLSLVLVGLPELHDRLRLGVHRSLLTRIGTLVDIGVTTPEDTAAYVRHRLERAGATRDLFASDGLTVLHELAAGVPRVLDAVAEAALHEAASREERLIGRATVRRAWQSTPYA
jgi:type II secretory pathway predicted ATPase ExeA